MNFLPVSEGYFLHSRKQNRYTTHLPKKTTNSNSAIYCKIALQRHKGKFFCLSECKMTLL